jgi:hypothetical protein
MPVSAPSASRIGRTFRLCRSVRLAMSSASSSIETLAFTRRTFDWERMSLLRAMSREGDRVIFGMAVAIGIISATGAERLSLGFQPVTKTGAALSLSSAGPQFGTSAGMHHRSCRWKRWVA